ncbi:MAG: spermidine/putrescine ABC transporter substrate-binding protein [Rhodospirillales bacterium]
MSGLKSLGLAAVLALGLPGLAQAADEVNLLAWCDHDDPSIYAPFEAETGIKVNVKVYELTGAAISILEQSDAGDWDVFIVDTADVLRMAEAGWLEPLDPADFPYDKLFEGAKTPHLHELDGTLYGVPEKFGFNTLAYDGRKVGADGREVSLDLLFDPAMKDRVAVYDYYLPIILTLGMRHGVKPADFDAETLAKVREDLFALKDNAKIVGDLIATQTALATGDVDLLIGAAEWVAPLQAEKPYLDWGTPVEGGLRWSQSVALFKDSEKKAAALNLAQYLMSPEGQARVALAPCYNAMPTNSAAALDAAQKASLRWAEIDAFLANTYDYGAVSPELDEEMVEVWTEFLAH